MPLLHVYFPSVSTILFHHDSHSALRNEQLVLSSLNSAYPLLSNVKPWQLDILLSTIYNVYTCERYFGKANSDIPGSTVENFPPLPLRSTVLNSEERDKLRLVKIYIMTWKSTL